MNFDKRISELNITFIGIGETGRAAVDKLSLERKSYENQWSRIYCQNIIFKPDMEPPSAAVMTLFLIGGAAETELEDAAKLAYIEKQKANCKGYDNLVIGIMQYLPGIDIDALAACFHTLVLLPARPAGHLKTEDIRKAEKELFIVADMICATVFDDGVIGIDFHDICTVLHDGGLAEFRYAFTEKNILAAPKALEDFKSIRRAKKVLMTVDLDPQIGGLDDVEKEATLVNEAAHPEVWFIFAAHMRSELCGKRVVYVLATAFESQGEDGQ